MSAIQMLIANIQALSPEDRSAVFSAFGLDSAKAKAVKAEKKPRANAGRGTAWSAFTLKIQQEHKEEMDALKLEAAAKRKAAKDAGLPVPDDTKGAHLHWCSAYKTAHEDEWKAFKTTWELEHPKVVAGPSGAESSDDAATVVDEASAPPAAVGGGGSSAAAEAPAKKRGPKKMADMTPEEQAAAKAKRAAKKAEKASATNSADVSRAPSPPKPKSD